MDYGKYSYVKLSEFDGQLYNKTLNSNSALEYSLPVINHSVTDVYTLNIAKVQLNGKTYFQNNIVLSCLTEGEVAIELLLDGVVVESISRTIKSGENALLLMKTYSPKLYSGVDVDIRIKCVSANYTVNVISNILAVWGAVADLNASAPSSIRSLVLDNQVVVSFVEKNKIYYALVNKQEQSIASGDFSQIATGISHCFALDKSHNLFLFRVDTNKNLYYCQFGTNQAETLIDTNVNCVYASKCPDSMQEEMLICYLKNGKPSYRTYKNAVIGAECIFDCPNAKYSDIYVAKTDTANRMYVVCTSSNGNNYIFISEEDSLLSGFAENLSIGAAMTVSRYITYKNLTDSIAETLNADVEFVLGTHYLAYQEFFNSGIAESLSSTASFLCETYEKQIFRPLLYTLEFEQTETYPSSVEQDGVTHKPRIIYGEDAAGWIPVNPNIPTSAPLGPGTFDDVSGLNQKWPFNEIKPCLMQNGEIVGYLQPNDFSKFENGAAADIYSGDYDVMIQFPKMYWKLEQDWDGVKTVASCSKAYIKISISNVPRTGFVCPAHTRAGQEYDYIYVGAYESNISNGHLYCCSGKLPTSSLTHVEVLQQWSNLRGNTYTTLDYHFATYIYILSMLYFGEQYGPTHFGNGWVTIHPSYIENSGVLDQSGMFYGSSAYGSGNGSTEIYMHNKLFGLENIWGHSKTYVDGILYNESRKYLIIDPTNPNSTHNLLGTGYREVDTQITQNYSNGSWVTIWLANNDYGFLPTGASTNISNKIYKETRCCQYRPSSYRYFTANSDCPHMIFSFGGECQRHSGFGCVADRDYSVNDIYHNERIMCYPTSKLSQ